MSKNLSIFTHIAREPQGKADMVIERTPHGCNPASSDDEARSTAPQKNSRRPTAVDEHTEELDEMQSTAAMSNPEDRQFGDDFIQRVMELAQETVGGQSQLTAIELMQLAGYRIQAKVKRVPFNKINLFNHFLKENKTAENGTFRRPVRGKVDIIHGRPSFIGAYQKHMSDEYKLRKADYEPKAKELNDAHMHKLTTESGVVAWLNPAFQATGCMICRRPTMPWKTKS
jgi:hypothetical protein